MLLSAGPLNIAGPEDAKPAPLMHVLARDTAKLLIDTVRRAHSEGGLAFNLEIGRGWLVQPGSGGIHFSEGHGGQALLKKHVSPEKFGLSIKNMLQIEPRNSQRKHTPDALLVPETPESITAGLVFS